ncbi:hypothetical protein LMH87_009587 [Akanthomyces muscarius]|uniref:Uncharacterized protein n=1 Tax=Akanthomyces muscarius TaxID=2231603 RepID=A0A9W8QD86_AKAMU|nr:hypothetical protein LMH87_009587 [Akanthomyces muscarius]KAJ4153082.1 hypothetical protein LMH87_009587 [Akanthomyces muscarius]
MLFIHRRLKLLAGFAFTLIVVFSLWHQTALSMESVSGDASVKSINSNTSIKTASPNAYVFYATEDVYACSVLVNIHRLRHMYHTKHRILVFVSSGVSKEYLTRFTDLEAKVILETPPPLSAGSSPYYKDCLLKLVPFRVYELDRYIQRCLILDSDQLIMQNLDAIFQSASTDIAAAPAYWISNDTLSSTCMLVEPSRKLWEQVQTSIASILPGQYDMDIINDMFRDNAHRLPGSYITINSHWEDRNVPKWFDIEAGVVPFPDGQLSRPASDDELEDLYRRAYIIHFFAIGKPWMRTTEEARRSRPKSHPILFKQWEEWRQNASQLCYSNVVQVI